MLDNNIPQITNITIPDHTKWVFWESDLKIEEVRKGLVSVLAID